MLRWMRGQAKSSVSGARRGHRNGLAVARRSMRNAATPASTCIWPPREASCMRSEEHTSELQSLMRISYDVFCLKKKPKQSQQTTVQLCIVAQTNYKTDKY